MSIEGKDLFSAMNNVQSEDPQYSIRNANGEISLRKFNAAYDWSLDSIKLAEIYEKRTRRKNFAFKHGRHMYTQQVICVTFKYAYKEFNMAGKNTYIKNGYNYRDCIFKDGVYLRGGELIAIQTNVEVSEPISQEILGKYFSYVDGVYKCVGNIPTLMDKSELRSWLYENGFKCDGIEYVRYKRSGGSSRVGKCLFVNKLLYDKMSEWDKCGLAVEEGQKIDLAAWEAYISLPMSSIIDTIEIPLDNILVIDDYESEFEDEVIAVETEKNKLVSGKKTITIKNNIWDGQSLMDTSLFGKYSDKGMLLIRNRFFKSCCFNTNIQKWFEDNNIDSVDKLNGFTLAEDISQIKLITTPSSLKYAKFGKIENWFKNVEPIFGIVKHDKPTHYMDGTMVQIHYQLLNTLHMSYEEMERFLKPSIDYITAVRRNPAVLRYEINYPIEEDDEEAVNSLKSKNEIVFKLLGINDDFAKTKLYYDFRDDLVRGLIRNIKRGHVLVNGNYSTMIGNGLEMLKASCGMFNGDSEIPIGSIHSKRFPFDKMLLCSRSPHVTMGNILLVNNTENENIDRYFNLTNEIVYVNAINENIQQRLNGCDYDSDTILITDNSLLIDIAKKHYDEFKVPTSLVTAKKSVRHYTDMDKADLDVKTSVNKIGEIINLSQVLNSILWDRINRGSTVSDCSELYQDICKLAVLSGMEIDKAKKEFVINSVSEINTLKSKYKIAEKDKQIKPNFFKMITLENGFELCENVRYKYFDTSMDYLQRIISKFNFRESRECKRTVLPFMSIVKEPPNCYRKGFYYAQKDKIIETVKRAKEETRKLYIDYDTKSKEEKELIWAQAAEIKQECVEAIDQMSNNQSIMYLVLRELDGSKYKDISRYVFEVLFGKPNESFFRMIELSKDRIYGMVETDEGELNYYGHSFTMIPIR